MGRAVTRNGPTSPVEAVADALSPALKRMTLSRAEEISGVSVGTLRRLAGGELKSVKADVIEKLRRLPGFSAEFDRLMGQADATPAALRLGQRLLRAFPGSGAELVLYNLECLGEDVDAEAVAELLRNTAALLAAKRRPSTDQKKMPLPADSSRI